MIAIASAIFSVIPDSIKIQLLQAVLLWLDREFGHDPATLKTLIIGAIDRLQEGGTTDDKFKVAQDLGTDITRMRK